MAAAGASAIQIIYSPQVDVFPPKMTAASDGKGELSSRLEIFREREVYKSATKILRDACDVF